MKGNVHSTDIYDFYVHILYVIFYIMCGPNDTQQQQQHNVWLEILIQQKHRTRK